MESRSKLLIILRCLLLHFLINISMNETANCTTGYTINKLSFNSSYCCSYICADKESPRYNLRHCCNSTCANYYVSICNPDAANLSKGLIISTSRAPSLAAGLSTVNPTTLIKLIKDQSTIEFQPNQARRVTDSIQRSKIVSNDQLRKSHTNPTVNNLWTKKDFKGVKQFSYIFTKVVTTKLIQQQFPSKLIATRKIGTFGTNYVTSVTVEAIDNKFAIHISILICISFTLIVMVCLLIVWLLLRKKHKQGFINENKLSCYNKVNRDFAAKSASADGQLVAQQQSETCTEISFCPDESHCRNSKLILDIDVETYFKPIPVEIVENIEVISKPVFNQKIHPDQIIVHEKLGQGFFGQVHKGTWHNTGMLDPGIEVALKTPNSNGQFSSDFDIYCLQLELKILSFVGPHPNIIQLLGVIPQPSRIGNFVIATEFCQLGDLRSYIEKRISYHEVSLLDKPIYSEIDAILATNCVCNSALLMYALQIANGAHFLTHTKTVIHRDLALRNMLLTNDHVVKIGDFGLAVNDSAYEVKTRKMLPTRWLAPESLNGMNAVFTAQSDVWSFGVLLWELFSLAGDPIKLQYAPRDREQFRQWLISGYRFDRPEFAPEMIAVLMKKCWNFEPECRPTFSQCRTEIKNYLINYSSDVYDYLADKIFIDEIC